MRPTFSLAIFITFLISSNLLSGQETADSILLNPKLNHAFSIPGINDFNIDFNKLEITPENEKRFEKYIFKDKSWTQFELKEGVKKFPDGRLYLTYTSTNQSFHYFTTGDPISLQFDFHLKPLTHFEKVDLYFFGNALLVHNYPVIGSTFSNNSTKEFFWESGVGVEYQYKEKKYLFYEYSTGFQNQSFLGKRNKAGVKFKF